MSGNRKEDREAAQKKFRSACKDGAGMTESQMRDFSHFMHDNNMLVDYMSYQEIVSRALSWLSDQRR